MVIQFKPRLPTVGSANEGSIPTQLQRKERLVDVRVQLNQDLLKQPSQLAQLPLFVVNNAIIMVETANQIREETGVDRHTAITTAAPQRLRPILMTTITTVLGLFPLALGIGEGSEFLQPLGIVVFSGLTLATLLTLLSSLASMSSSTTFSVGIRALSPYYSPPPAFKKSSM